MLTAEIIPAQDGNEIICTGPVFVYSHDTHQHGVDVNLKISGNAGFIAETLAASGSFYIDTVSKNNRPAVFDYTFVTEPGAVLGDVFVSSRATIFRNAGDITGHYRVGDETNPWIEFLNFDGRSGVTDIRPIDKFENIHDSRITIRYSLNRYGYEPWDADVQLFRSVGPLPNPGQPGNFAFNFTATLTTDIEAHKADLAGDDLFIGMADFEVLAGDFGQTGPDLAGDINGDEKCDIFDLLYLAGYWMYDCYEND